MPEICQCMSDRTVCLFTQHTANWVTLYCPRWKKTVSIRLQTLQRCYVWAAATLRFLSDMKSTRSFKALTANGNSYKMSAFLFTNSTKNRRPCLYLRLLHATLTYATITNTHCSKTRCSGSFTQQTAVSLQLANATHTPGLATLPESQCRGAHWRT